ncbi:zinc ABC transporter substrate-binding protein [Tessaracoccus defluvii]|uniref:Zinc ABC transporter substrate-binding protein n=2 Tax=Tessaracoccus defluvii TaxID=1285901 RepID=A0A7H0H8V9_9ACTN|nr:zinc ABC transporter substrate-binding protein [Tessaracoccus defluvii]
MILMTKRLALSLTAVLALSACAGSPADSPGGDHGEAGPRVVAAFYPLEWASSQALGTLGAVDTLTAPGAEAHDLELTPRQIASLAEADLVVYLKGFQPAVDNAIEQSGADRVLDVGELVSLLPADGAHHDHGDEAGHDEEEHSVDDGHDHGAFDPHFWQDPERMSQVVEALADELAAIDPANADAFAAAALAAARDLTALDEEFAVGLEQCARREFITTHTSFGYLADRYDLTEIGIAGLNPDDEPSPARIAAIHDEATAHGITTIFFETLTSDAVAKAIAGDLGLHTAVLDPLEGITEQSPGQDYPAIMRANLEALRSANDCA